VGLLEQTNKKKDLSDATEMKYHLHNKNVYAERSLKYLKAR
jgi:hypothetical protein